MKLKYPNVSLDLWCSLLGYSRQAWYQKDKFSTAKADFEDKVLTKVKTIRESQKRLGTRKLHLLVNKDLSAENLSIGRDALFNLLRDNNMLVRVRRKYRPAQTDGNGKSIYPDFRKDLKVSRIEKLWSCDITYIELLTEDRHCYLTLIIDEYSHLIVGYHISLRMTAEETIKALKMAVKKAKDGPKFKYLLIFHSDRGSQFKSSLFSKYMDIHEVKQSMCAKGKSHENPVSERLNGIIKNELLYGEAFASLKEAIAAIEKAIYIYNNQRPHQSIELLTPEQAHQKGQGPLKKLWKQRKAK